MFVAITEISEYGQPLYCINPVKTSTNLGKAFTWNTYEDAERTLKEAKEIYDLEAFIVKMSEPKAKQKSKPQNNNLVAI
jgi:hypothetical protein